MKRFQIILVVSALVLAAVLGVILIISFNQVIPADDPGDYEYGFTEEGDNIRLTIKGAVDDGFSWTPEEQLPGSVRVTEKSRTSKKTVFTLAADRSGVYHVSFSLDRADVLPDTRYVITVNLYADINGKLTVAGYSHKTLSGLQTVGAQSAHPAFLSPRPDGTLQVLIRNVAEEAWAYWQTKSGVVQVTGGSVGDGTALFTVSPIDCGGRTVYLYENESHAAIRLDLDADPASGVSVTGAETATFIEEEHKDERRRADVETVAGVIHLPEQAEYQMCNTKALEDPDGIVYPAAFIDCTADGLAWRIFVIPQEAPAAVARYYGADPETAVPVTVGDGEAAGYFVTVTRREGDEQVEKQGFVVIWIRSDGFTFAVFATDADMNAAAAMAAAVAQVNPAGTDGGI